MWTAVTGFPVASTWRYEPPISLLSVAERSLNVEEVLENQNMFVTKTLCEKKSEGQTRPFQGSKHWEPHCKVGVFERQMEVIVFDPFRSRLPRIGLVQVVAFGST